MSHSARTGLLAPPDARLPASVQGDAMPLAPEAHKISLFVDHRSSAAILTCEPCGARLECAFSDEELADAVADFFSEHRDCAGGPGSG